MDPAPDIDEQARFNTTSDVYSFGIIMWEMLAADYPFPGVGGALQLQKKIVEGLRPSLDKLPKDVPEALKTLITRCWSAEQSKRPTMREVHEVLTAAL
jgi:serine/threonine protein kinase